MHNYVVSSTSHCPIELSQDQAKELVSEYVQSAFVDKGMIADIALHDLASGNPHAHVMLTMRDLDGEEFGNKNRSWNDKALLNRWREGWAEAANHHLELAGEEARIDYRSLEEQGVDRQPTVHMGVAAMEMEQRGVETRRGNINRLVHAANQELSALVDQLKELGDRLGTRAKDSVAGLQETIKEGVPKARALGFGQQAALAGGISQLTAEAEERKPPNIPKSSAIDPNQRPDTSRGMLLIERLKAEKREKEAEQERQQEIKRQERAAKRARERSRDRGFSR